jgi:hypothetical protein
MIRWIKCALSRLIPSPRYRGADGDLVLQGISKPWFLAAWSSCIGQAQQYNGDLDSSATDDLGAPHATDMFAIASNTGVSGKSPAMAATGSDFWNVGAGNAPTCSINPGFSKTFTAVKAAQ